MGEPAFPLNLEMEPRARAGKHVGKETFNPKESKFFSLNASVDTRKMYYI